MRGIRVILLAVVLVSGLSACEPGTPSEHVQRAGGALVSEPEADGYAAIRDHDAERLARMLAEGRVELGPPSRPNRVNKPLAYAAAYGNLAVVKLPVEAGADLNGQVAYGDGPLIKAAEHDNWEIARYLMEQGADVNRPNSFGVSFFTGLCHFADVELVQFALDHGGQVNQQQPGSFTALHAAVTGDNVEVISLLLANGGDPRIRNAEGRASLELAREPGHAEVLRLLEAHASQMDQPAPERARPALPQEAASGG